MKKIQILWDFIRLSVTEKVAFYQNVIAKLTDNPTYPSPPIALSDAKTAVDTLDASIIAARDGSHFSVSTMHDNESNYSVPLFDKEGLGEILLDKSPSIPLFQRGR